MTDGTLRISHSICCEVEWGFAVETSSLQWLDFMTNFSTSDYKNTKSRFLLLLHFLLHYSFNSFNFTVWWRMRQTFGSFFHVAAQCSHIFMVCIIPAWLLWICFWIFHSLHSFCFSACCLITIFLCLLPNQVIDFLCCAFSKCSRINS